MAFKSIHVKNNMNVDVEFPCPECKSKKAKGTFKKSEADEDGHIDIHCDCACGCSSFLGTAIVHQPDAQDIEVTIDDPRVKDNQLNVSAY